MVIHSAPVPNASNRLPVTCTWLVLSVLEPQPEAAEALRSHMLGAPGVPIGPVLDSTTRLWKRESQSSTPSMQMSRLLVM